MSEEVRTLLCVVGIPFIALNFAAGLIWVERRLLAVWQERYGPNRVGPFGLLQPIADAISVVTRLFSCSAARPSVTGIISRNTRPTSGSPQMRPPQRVNPERLSAGH